MIKVLTFYFTKDESTLNVKGLRSVLTQVGVSQDIYVVSASPVNLERYGFHLPNIVVSTKPSWPVPVKIGFSFNVALLLVGERINNYQYIFKVDGDVVIPKDYLINLMIQKPLIAGIGPALLISTTFFKKLLKNKYPVNYCDDGFILALAISKGIWPLNYKGKELINMPPISTLKDREYIYGIEYYKWGMPFILLLILPLTRIYLKIAKKMKPYQRKELKAYLFNIIGYIHAFIHKFRKYDFHREYRRMRIRHLYDSVVRTLL